jgi:hypothetical protein
MLPALLLAAVAEAGTGEYRVGIFVGNDKGLPSEAPLHFATSDAAKMRDLFVEHGGIAPDDAILLADQPVRNVVSQLVIAKQRIAQAEAAGKDTVLVFYYSGHGDEAALHLGETTLAHAELRTWLESSGADVRIGLLDSCESGGAVRNKGGTRGPAYAFAVDVEQTKGTAILTSSASTEASQESDELGGGFFTHYLHTALTGAADENHDGDVTLAEAKSYVHTETVFRTRETAGSQTPGYDFDLVGAGEIRLTRLEKETSALVFPGGLDGTYAVWDETRKRYVAEVPGAAATRIAVPDGVYYVHRRMPGWVDEASYTVRKGAAAQVSEVDFVSVAYEDSAERGDLAKQARRATMPDWTVRVMMGGRSFGANSVYALQYVPAHSVAGLEVSQRYHNWMYASFDFLAGSTTNATLSFQELAPTPVAVGSTSFGATLGWSPSWGPLLFGVGARAETIAFSRKFLDEDLAMAPQSSRALAPGLAFAAGGRLGHVTVDLGWNLMILPVDWDGNGFALYGEGLLRFGWQL